MKHHIGLLQTEKTSKNCKKNCQIEFHRVKKYENKYHKKTSEITGLAWEFRRILEFVLFELMITFGQRIGSSLRKEKHQWPSSIYVWKINLSVCFAPVIDTSHSVVYSLCVCEKKYGRIINIHYEP